MIKAVVFDLDGVYFESGTTTFKRLLNEKYGLSEESIVDVYLRSNEMQQYKKSLINGDTFWNWAIKTWGIDSTKEELIELLMDSYEENSTTVEYVKNLKGRGIKTAVCTNNFPERLNGLHDKFGFMNNFDVVIASFELGVTKPDPEIFQELARRLKCNPNEIIMSDDREENVVELNELGFIGQLYTTWEEFESKVNSQI
jgi:putative hydrolase of the HAD superfamily